MYVVDYKLHLHDCIKKVSGPLAHMFCKSIRLLETNFSFSKTMPAYLLYGMELFTSRSCHTPLTGVLAPDPCPIGHT